MSTSLTTTIPPGYARRNPSSRTPAPTKGPHHDPARHTGPGVVARRRMRAIPGRRRVVAGGAAREAGHGAVPGRAGEKPPPRHRPGPPVRLPRRARQPRRLHPAGQRPHEEGCPGRLALDDPRPARSPARQGRGRRHRLPRSRETPARRPARQLLPRSRVRARRPAGRRRRGVRAGHCPQTRPHRFARHLPGARPRLPARPKARAGPRRLG